MIRIRAALAGLASLALAPFASAQTPAASLAAAASAAESGESVIVDIPKLPKHKELYKFFRDLDSNAICPMTGETPRGYACAEITYDVFDADGTFVRKCNVPIFRINELIWREYSITTFKKYDCSNPKKRKLEVEHILLKDILDPRTRDKTTFKPVSIIGLRQAKDFCKVSDKACVSDLFNHTEQLSFKALQSLWGIGAGASARIGPPIMFETGWPSDSIVGNFDLRPPCARTSVPPC
jgi:hypothetical protein